MPSSTSGSLPPGAWEPPSVEELQRLLPQYEISELLGRGGMGAVYKGRQKTLDRPVAIKLLPETLQIGGSEHSFVERFKLEARAMANLDHPAIISVYDFGETSEGHLYFVMEFIDGMDLQKYLEVSGGKLPDESAIAIIAHVLDALAFAHENGIVHRDIKPANVLINSRGQVKIADFGLAKQFNEVADAGGLTMTNVAMGTPHYMAPEATLDSATSDGRADLYAVGVMLYQMLTGDLPRGMFKMPHELDTARDQRFDKIIARALEPDPDHRFGTAGEFRGKIDELLSQPVTQLEGGSAEAASQIHAVPAGGGRLLNTGNAAQSSLQRSREALSQPGPKPVVKKASGAAKAVAALVVVAAIGIAAFMLLDRGKQGADSADSVAAAHSPEDEARMPPAEPAEEGSAQPGAGAGAGASVNAGGAGQGQGPTATQAAMPAPAATGDWIDLLAGADLEAGVGSPGSWERDVDGVYFSGDDESVLTLAGIESGHYELVMDFRSDGNMIKLVVPVGDAHATFILRTDVRNPVAAKYTGHSGMEYIDGFSASDPQNPTHVFPSRLLTGQPNEFRVVVERVGADRYAVRSELNAEPFTEWEGAPSALSKHPGLIISGRDRFAIGTLDRGMGTAYFTSLRLRDVASPSSLLTSDPPLPSADPNGSVALMDGEDFSGWEVFQNRLWRVEDGAFVASAKGASYLYRSYQHPYYELTGEFIVSENGNGGVIFRIPSPETLNGKARFDNLIMQGFELQIVGSGYVGLKAGMGGVYAQGSEHASLVGTESLSDDTWTPFRIRVTSSHVQAWIGSMQTVDLAMPIAQNYGRFIALQKHNEAERVGYRKLRIRRLEADGTTSESPSFTESLGGRSTTLPDVAELHAQIQRFNEKRDELYAPLVADFRRGLLGGMNAAKQRAEAGAVEAFRAAGQQLGVFEKELKELPALGGVQATPDLPELLADAPAGLVTMRAAFDSRAAEIETFLAGALGQAFDLIDADLTGKLLTDDAEAVRGYRASLAIAGDSAGSTATSSNGSGEPAPGESADDSEWLEIFDGTSLQGWRGAPNTGAFSVEDGLLKITATENSMLYYTGRSGGESTDYQDFELQTRVKVGAGGNSGVFFHTRTRDDVQIRKGHEIQIFMGDERATGTVFKVDHSSAVTTRAGVWYDLTIRVEGKRVTTFIDGKQAVQWTEPVDWQPPAKYPEKRLGSGTFAVQGWTGIPGQVDTTVWYDKIRVRRLNGK